MRTPIFNIFSKIWEYTGQLPGLPLLTSFAGTGSLSACNPREAVASFNQAIKETSQGIDQNNRSRSFDIRGGRSSIPT